MIDAVFCRSRISLSGAALLLAACAAQAPVETGVAGEPTEVVVLDAAFVEFEGERRPLEFFLLEVRRRCRAAGDDEDRLPAVRLAFAPAAQELGGQWLDAVIDELRKAGIRHLNVGGDG